MVLPLAPGSKGLINNQYITEEWRVQGLSLHEEGDHILELRHQGQVLARFSQTGTTVENILKVAQKAMQERRN